MVVKTMVKTGSGKAELGLLPTCSHPLKEQAKNALGVFRIEKGNETRGQQRKGALIEEEGSRKGFERL